MTTPALLRVALLAFLPISEVRGAIPYGIWGANLPPFLVITVAVLVNLAPYFLVMYFLQAMLGVLRQVEWFNHLFQRYVAGVTKRFQRYARWEKWGIFLFVGVPLPFTGVWTGSLICFLGGLSIKESFLFVLGGLLLATFLVSIFTLLGYNLWFL